MDLRETAGELRVRWLDVLGVTWLEAATLRGRGTTVLEAPGAGKRLRGGVHRPPVTAPFHPISPAARSRMTFATHE